MSFVQRAATPPASRNLCTIGGILDNLPDDEAAALDGMLADIDRWPHTGKDSILEALLDEGYEVGEKVVRTHRGGTCRCRRAAAA